MLAASQISARERIAIDLNDWEQIWALLDKYGTRAASRATEYLYAIVDRSSGMVKFGKSRRITSRVRELKTGNPRELKVWAFCPNSPPFTEQEAHQSLAAHRVTGEWFVLNEATRAYINAMRAHAGL